MPASPSRPWRAPTLPSSAPATSCGRSTLTTLPDADTTLARRLTVVKVAKPNQDLRFDVPVAGLPTIETMRRAGATCLCIEAGRTLLFDREAMIAAANAAGIAVIAEEIPSR